MRPRSGRRGQFLAWWAPELKVGSQPQASTVCWFPSSLRRQGDLRLHAGPEVAGRESGEIRLEVCHHSDRKTLQPFVEERTPDTATVYTDE